MASKSSYDIKGINEVEEALGLKLKKKEEKEGGPSIIFEAHGKKYPTITQNLIDDFITWFKARRGGRAVLLYLSLFLVFYVIYVDFPEVLGLIFLSPVIYTFAEIFAWLINKGKKRPILQLQVERKAVPVTLVTDADGQEIKTMMFAPSVTGWDLHYVWDEAISDTPHPGGVVIPNMVTVPHVRTKQRMAIIEYKSPDGKFGAANPFRTLESYFLLSGWQKPRAALDKRYQEFMAKISKLPDIPPEVLVKLKTNDRFIRQCIGDLSQAAYSQQTLLKKYGHRVARIGKIDLWKEDFLAKLDRSNDPIVGAYLRNQHSAMNLTMNDQADLINDANALLAKGHNLHFILPRLKHRVRLELLSAEMKMREPDMGTLFKLMKQDQIRTGAPKSSVVLKLAEEEESESEED